MFKIEKKLAPEFICNLIKNSNSNYLTRSHYQITETEDGSSIDEKSKKRVPKVHKVKSGIDTVSFTGPKIWNSLPEKTKNSKTIDSFKKNLKELDLTRECPCSICKTFIPGVGYMN